jgi:L-threonylcarbamoyladenylate synthase
MILPASPAAIEQAAQALRAGELVALPTETVYGLGADACQDAAVARIFAAKGRPADHPLIVHVACSAQVPDYADQVPDFAQRLMAAFWPGPLTLILPRRQGVAAAAAGGQNSIGLRCPSHPVAQALLRAAGVGLAAPSANQFGRVSPTTAAHVEAEFGRDLLILDGGPCAVGIESTIVDCTRGAPVLLRPGSITRARIEQACGQLLRSPESMTQVAQAAPRASGTLASHYAPRAKLRLMDAGEIEQRLASLGVHASNLGLWCRHRPTDLGAGVFWLAQPSESEAAAQSLFAVLRELDARGVQQIWVELPPDTPDWEGVRDRLNRAAA